jgi:S-adenosyl methyltransferase
VSEDRVFPWNEAERDLTSGIDTTVPASARIWNYWLGGKDHYPADRQAGPPASTHHIHADLNHPGALLDEARAALDFSRPAAVLLMQVLGHIGDPRDGDHTALAVAGQVKDALPPGGYLVISEIADTDPALNAALHHYRQSGAVPYHARRPEQIARFFDGLVPAPPGVVPIGEWRPDPSPFTVPAVPAWGRSRD